MSKFVVTPINTGLLKDTKVTKILVDSSHVIGLCEMDGVTILTVEDKRGSIFSYTIEEDFDSIAEFIIF